MDPFHFVPGQDVAAVYDDDYLMSLGLVLSPLPPAVLPGGAFEPYQWRAPEMSRRYSGENLHRRMFSYLRRLARDAAAASTEPVAMSPAPPADETTVVGPSSQPPHSSRFRHIMRERLRRERLSQGFADLHALLPPGASSKGGKNDIVGAAASYIRELGARKEWLSARNEALLERAATLWRGGGGGTGGAGGRERGMVVTVRAESEDHSVAVDAFERVLQRIRAMKELRVTAIRSRFSAGGMWMNVGVEGQVSGRDVDKAITNALMDLESNDPRSSKPSFTCQVERGLMG